MKLEHIIMPVAVVVSSIAIAASIALAAFAMAPQTIDSKHEAVNDCLTVAQEIQERGDQDAGWSVITNKFDKDTYSFCMGEKGYSVAQ